MSLQEVPMIQPQSVALVLLLGLSQAPAPNVTSPDSGVWMRKPVPAGTVGLLPSFRAGQGGPEFLLEFTNASPDSTDALNVFLQETVHLDGTEYPRLVVRWAGTIPLIPPNGRWSHTLGIADFLPAEPGNDWRLPLADGVHSVRVSVGSATSVEIKFAWKPAN